MTPSAVTADDASMLADDWSSTTHAASILLVADISTGMSQTSLPEAASPDDADMAAEPNRSPVTVGVTLRPDVADTVVELCRVTCPTDVAELVAETVADPWSVTRSDAETEEDTAMVADSGMIVYVVPDAVRMEAIATVASP